MLADLLFLLFASILLVAGLGVITAKNPMYCVLFMVLAFFNASGLFILLGAEFLGLLLIMVYVGAIAVMFLFVLMTIDIDFAVLKEDSTTNYLPIGVLVAVLLFIELVAAGWGGMFSQTAAPVVPVTEENTVQLGKVLFTEYLLPFQGAAMILLTAMIGAIVLTHRRRDNVKRQNIGKQIFRKREDSVMLTSPKSGEGLTHTFYEPKSAEED